MNHSISELIKRLAELQQSSGAFQSSSTATPEPMDSIYFTSLILLSLATITENNYLSDINRIVDRAIDFLLTNESISTTWNYLPRNTVSPYPDDLDDTFLALSAIEHWKKDYLTPERLAHITNTLVRCEVTPGGPYKTWISEVNNTPPWNDVDPVVNTTINRWLCAHDIYLGPLQTFLDTQNVSAGMSSLYYHNKFFVNYLIHSPEKSLVLEKNTITKSSRDGHPIEKIISEILYLRTHNQTNTISSDYSHQPNHYSSHYQEKLVARVLSHKTPFDFYIEKIENNNCHYAYSAAMELVLCIELLGIASQTSTERCIAQDLPTAQTLVTDQLSAPALEHLSQVRETVTAIFSDSEPIRDFFVKQLNQSIQKSLIELLLPYYYYESLHPHLQKRITLDELVIISSAHAIGIITFTLQDEICDRHTSPEQIPYVTSGCIAMESLFQRALFQIASHESLREILYRMNTALIRETSPDNHTPLSRGELGDKSIGLVCGILAIITIIGGKHSRKESEKVIRIFSKFLSARQLLDDCHDWLDDHTAGRTTYVTQQMTPSPSPAYFWNQVFPKLYTEVVADLENTETMLSDLHMIRDTYFLKNLIEKLKLIFIKTYSERNNLLQFISVYEKTTLASGVEHA